MVGLKILIVLLMPVFLTTVVSSRGIAQPLEDWRGRVIYFALVDRFANANPGNDNAYGDPDCNNPRDPHAFQGGDLEGLTERLSYIDELGATAIWVSPLYRGVKGRAGSNCGFPGYWADFDFPYSLELDPRYGSAKEFDEMLFQSHQLNLPVMLDMVVNHAGYQAKLLRQKPDWFVDPNNCHLLGDPEIFCPLAGLPDFLHSRPDAQEYLVELHLQWLRRFPIDAIRMDTVKHVEPWFFSLWNQRMRAERDNLYIIGELLDEGSLDKFPPYMDAGFDGLFNFPLRADLIDAFARGATIDRPAHRIGETIQRFGEKGADLMVNLLDNHDVRRFLEEMPKNLGEQEVLARYKLALTALLTLPGIPQIYYGNEVGMYGGYDPDNRRFMPEWAFSEEGRSRNYSGFITNPQRVYSYTKKLLELRKKNPALRIGRYTELWRQNGPQNPNVWVFLRHDETTGSKVVVAINNGDAVKTPLKIGMQGYFANGVVLENMLDQKEHLLVRDGSLNLSLDGKSAKIFFIKAE